MTAKQTRTTTFTCDWRCGATAERTDTQQHQRPKEWGRIMGGGDVGQGDPYPLYLCPDCWKLYEVCKQGLSTPFGLRFRAIIATFWDNERRITNE